MQVEFYGIPRQRTGLSQLQLPATTLGALMVELIAQFPDLADPQRPEHLHPAYTLNLNGQRFVSDPRQPLAESDVVLVLSADAGGV
jgi:molybdopterin converting factor small subunit